MILPADKLQPIRMIHPISFAQKSVAVANPLPKILKWRRRLDQDPSLTICKLAERESVTRSRIGQMLELANLHPDIIQSLRNLPGLPLSMSRLRKLVRLPPHDQVRRFRDLAGAPPDL